MGHPSAEKLVWLTEKGHQRLRDETSVLDPDMVAPAMHALDPADRSALIDGLAAVIAAAQTTLAKGNPS